MDTMEQVKEFLAGLPEETDHEFDEKITRYVNHMRIEENINELHTILEEENTDRIKYAAFYSLILYYRNQKDQKKITKLFNNYRAAWEKHETFRHLELVCNLRMGIWSSSQSGLQKTLQDAQELAQKHATKASIQLYREEFEDASLSIEYAINKEKPSRFDYARK